MNDLEIRLTVADHDRNGFIALAQWPRLPAAKAKALVDAVDETVSDDAEPDLHDAPFWFILDLIDCANGDLLDTSRKTLPTQTAMAIAPEQVRVWLDERPEPDECGHRPVPILTFDAMRALTGDAL